MSAKLPFGETVPYWQTGQSSPDTWIEKTKALLLKQGATNISEAFGSADGRGVFILQFSYGDERFRVAWPVLPSKSNNERASRIQAATFVYHDCKAKILTASVLGMRGSFIGNLLLPSGATVVEASSALIANELKPVALIGGPTK